MSITPSSRFPARLLAIATPADAGRELNRFRIDAAGIARMKSRMFTRCVHLSELRCNQAKILKQEILLLGGEAAMASSAGANGIDGIDLILIGTDEQLQQLCCKLMQQSFELPALAAELEVLLANASVSPKSWKTARRELALTRPLIMGILNVTPNSFSDGNRFFDPEHAIDRALEMVEQGADIIDIGGESTRPGAEPVETAEELRRVIPVLQQLDGKIACAISIDTWKSRVAREALAAGAEIINDISGFTFDGEMAAVAASTGAGAVLMHTRGTPDVMHKDTRYDDLLGEITNGLKSSVRLAETAGVERSRLAIDPGIGFAKDAAANLEILRRLRELQCLGLPILSGTSRKSFIGTTLGRDTGDRSYGTAATVALAIANGAAILRVHDVREMRDVADMTHAILNG